MKKLGILLASLFVMVLATQHVKADGTDPSGASASADATATIYTAIKIEKFSDLNFGRIFATPEGGKVQIQIDGTRSIADGTVVLFDTGSGHTPASFEVTGTPNAGFYIKLPTDDGGPSIPLTGPTDADPMEITSFVHGAGESPALDENGKKQFSVGGTLAVNPNQPAGIYTGTFDVIVAYN